MLHKFTCTECPTTPFFTTFAPVFDEPAFCPNCGQQSTVSYVGEVNHAARFEAIMEHMRGLYDLRKRPLKYALGDLADWMEDGLGEVCDLLDELQNDVESGETYEGVSMVGAEMAHK